MAINPRELKYQFELASSPNCNVRDEDTCYSEGEGCKWVPSRDGGGSCNRLKANDTYNRERALDVMTKVASNLSPEDKLKLVENLLTGKTPEGKELQRLHFPGTRYKSGGKRQLIRRGERGGVSQRFGNDLLARLGISPSSGAPSSAGGGEFKAPATFPTVVSGPFPTLSYDDAGNYYHDDADHYDGEMTSMSDAYDEYIDKYDEFVAHVKRDKHGGHNYYDHDHDRHDRDFYYRH
jgi:hypothetical protein